jgi:hypothetical protein
MTSVRMIYFCPRSLLQGGTISSWHDSFREWHKTTLIHLICGRRIYTPHCVAVTMPVPPEVGRAEAQTHCHSPSYLITIQVWSSRAKTAAARSLVNQRRVKMLLTFCLGRNVTFHHTVVIFYTSSVYLKHSHFCMITICTDLLESHWFCIPTEGEKPFRNLIFFFCTDNSI